MTAYIGPFSRARPVERHRPRDRAGSGQAAVSIPEIGDPEITIAGILAWARAEAETKLLGSVPLPVIEARTRACLTGGKGGGPCPHLRQRHAAPDPIGFCGACGCGGLEKARLSRKVTMRGVSRPAPCLWPS